MGLFGDKIVEVSSVVYNLAGEEKYRPQYRNALVIRNILSHTKQSIADTLIRGYLGGPGINLRSFFRWADEHYGYIGMPTGSLSVNSAITPSMVIPYLPNPEGAASAWVQYSDIDDADIERWAEQWILINRPDDINTNWRVYYNAYTGVMNISSFGGTSWATFTPADFDRNAQYLYVYYNLIFGITFGDITYGSIVSGEIDTSDWILDSSTGSTESINRNKNTHIVKTYSDARPPEETSVDEIIPTAYTLVYSVYHKDTYLGQIDPDTDDLYSNREWLNYWAEKSTEVQVTSSSTTEDIDEEGIIVTVTTTTTITQDVLIDAPYYRIDNQEMTNTGWSELRLFIYKLGGPIPALNDLINDVASYGKFFPYLPIRLYSNFLSESVLPDAYSLVKKAYKKIANKGSIDKLIEDVAANPDIADIDFAYIVFGVSLNVEEKACKKYLYNFFKTLMFDQAGGPNIYDLWLVNQSEYLAQYNEWKRWKDRQNDPEGEDFGDPEPDLPNALSLPRNLLKVANAGSVNTSFDFRINWAYINETTNQTGLGKPGAKKGELWFTYEGQDEFAAIMYASQYEEIPSTRVTERMRLWWQYEDNKYQYLDLVGFVHRNVIFNGQFVEITAHQAFLDEDESGFIVPLNYAVYRDMSLADSTQMSTACIFIVFNCYVEHKQKWYESGIFRIVLVIAVAIVSVAFTGGAGLGLLGTHLAVGSALGFTGLTAAIVGSVANAMAALVLSTVIETAASGIFGPEIGAIITSIFMFTAMQSPMNFGASGSLAFDWSSLIKVDNLLALTDAIAKGYGALVKGNIVDMYEDFNTTVKKESENLEKMANAYNAEFGLGGIIDPMATVGTAYMHSESSDSFLYRTLMTGSDIADMSNDLVNGYAELSLTLPNAYA